MQLSELIEKAKKILDEHGDLYVLGCSGQFIDDLTHYVYKDAIPDWSIEAGLEVAEVQIDDEGCRE